jgi:hypothetical protein
MAVSDGANHELIQSGQIVVDLDLYYVNRVRFGVYV